MLKLDNQTILLALAVAIGLAVLLQTIILLAMFITMRKVISAIREEAESVRTLVMPVIYDAQEILASSRVSLAHSQELFANSQKLLINAQGFLARVSPKIESTVGDVAEITRVCADNPSRCSTRPWRLWSVCGCRATGWTAWSRTFWTLWTAPGAL